MVEPVTDVDALIHELRNAEVIIIDAEPALLDNAADAIRTPQELVTSLEAELDQALGKLDDLLISSLPDGWVAVPLEPTPEMINAGFTEWERTWGVPMATVIYRAMISAVTKEK